MNRATYYMVEMDYPHETQAEREAFDQFYQHHIDMLLSIPGFLSAQRFHCVEAIRAPFLALYRLVGPEVLTSDAYTSKAGRMSVDPTIRVNMKNWDRNLVRGPEGTSDPDIAVGMDNVLMLVDRLTDDAPPLSTDLIPLEIIGLDYTVVQRGVAIKDLCFQHIPDGWEVRLWRPIHAIRISA